MRTILHSTDRMSANSSEAGLFILFLLVFALAASAYVLYHGIYLTEPDKVGSLSHSLSHSYSSPILLPFCTLNADLCVLLV